MEDPIQVLYRNVRIASGYCIVVYIGEYMCVIEKSYVYIYYDNIVTIYQIGHRDVQVTSCKRNALENIDRLLSSDLIYEMIVAISNGFHVIPYATAHEANFIHYDKYFA